MIVEGNRGIRDELLWPMSSVQSKHSSCGASSGGLFAAMFPDSDIAAKFKMQKDRFIYLIDYAIAPYIHNQLVRLINKSTYFSISFDESLTDSIQQMQMDLVIRYWDEAYSQVMSDRLWKVVLAHKHTKRTYESNA